jgi:putative tryptophan/tyrosine transport system substrate-binding protein
MRRRDLMKLAGCAALAPLLTAHAEQSAMPVIGFLSGRAAGDSKNELAAFLEGLRAGGWVEGQNVAVEYRWAELQYDRLPRLAAELVERQVVVIATGGGGVSARAAKAATTTIPIVFVAGDVDPVKTGLVDSLNRPGGNITGITPFTSVLGPKRLQMLHDLVPRATVIGMLVNPNFADAETQIREAREAALTLGLELTIVNASSESELDTAFSTFSKKQIGALLVGNDSLFLGRREQLAALTARYAIPAIYSYREYVAAGGLMSYAPSLPDAYRRVGNYVGKILQGTRPADLPVEQPTRIELVVNLKTAKALGLEVPPALLDLADEVIE